MVRNRTREVFAEFWLENFIAQCSNTVIYSQHRIKRIANEEVCWKYKRLFIIRLDMSLWT